MELGVCHHRPRGRPGRPQMKLATIPHETLRGYARPKAHEAWGGPRGTAPGEMRHECLDLPAVALTGSPGGRWATERPRHGGLKGWAVRPCQICWGSDPHQNWLRGRPWVRALDGPRPCHPLPHPPPPRPVPLTTRRDEVSRSKPPAASSASVPDCQDDAWSLARRLVTGARTVVHWPWTLNDGVQSCRVGDALVGGWQTARRHKGPLPCIVRDRSTT